MNTKMHYFYRDSSNYKVHSEVILKGEITQEQQAEIASCLHDATDFIPSQVGLFDNRFPTIEEDDGPWFELYPNVDFSQTELSPDVELSVDELVENFKKAKDRWDDESFYQAAADAQCSNADENDGEYIIAVESVIQYSGKSIVGMLPAKVVGVYDEDAMHEKVSSLVDDGYEIDGIHVFFAKDEIN